MQNLKWLAFPLGGIALTIALFASAAWLLPETPSDRVLLELAAVPCLLVLGWVLIGAPLLPESGQGGHLLILLPGMAAGIMLYEAATSRHAQLSPFMNGAAIALASLALGLAATWLMTSVRGITGETRAEKMMAAAFVFFLSGIGFFQPLLLLINAQADAVPALVVQGKVVRLHETHGKGAANYVQFSGAAAAWNSTGSTGEFTLPWRQYEAMHVGDVDCLTIHTGLLHLRWWTIDDCGLGAQAAAALAQWDRGDHAGAIGAFEAMAKTHPQVLNALSPAWFDDARRTLGQRHETDLYRRLLVLLLTPGFQPGGDPALNQDGLRYELAGLQVFLGDRAAARATMARVDDPVVLMMASLDPARSDLLPAGFDAAAAIKSAITGLQTAIGSQPASLGPVLRLARLHGMLGDGQAMIDVLRANKPGGDHPFMSASDAERRQWWTSLALGYRLIGQDAEAIHQFGRSMVNGGVNQDNGSALIELAQLQIDTDHPGDALQTLDKLAAGKDDWTAYGHALIRAVHGCAAARAGRTQAAAADYAALRDDPVVPPQVVIAVAACTGYDDDAAAAIVAALGRRDRKLQLLLSHFAPWPGVYHGSRAQQDLARLAQRADVRAALDRAGGPGTFDIPPL
jgi:hypothetical protein